MDRLTDPQVDFIMDQPIFFVATAAPAGRVNVSPKGMDSLRVLDRQRVVWLNLTGSGNETAAHVAANGRMTSGKPPAASTATRPGSSTPDPSSGEFPATNRFQYHPVVPQAIC